MTWAEWCGSNYDTNGYWRASESGVTNPSINKFINGVVGSDVIISGHAYSTGNAGTND